MNGRATTAPASPGTRPVAALGTTGTPSLQGPDSASSGSRSPAGFAPPAIQLPKGGGAVRGIGEKFSANPVTGTGSLTIPLPMSPGRSGFGPSLSLAYDSGAAHGPFGMGWGLGLPSITRKTDRGIPTYDDAAERDTFILSGAEDLVPVVGQDGPPQPPRTVGGTDYTVVRYRPRIEGLYARIERWTADNGDMHWRSISRDNVTTVYGKDSNSRIGDPADPRRRVFSWLICESYDDKGNAAVYDYVEEDSRGVDIAAAHERHRNQAEKHRAANRYLKSVRYGNRVSCLSEPDLRQQTWLFELVFDYGEHDAKKPTPKDEGEWLCRNDPFSTYRAGFEVRTYRLCQRILMFHHFPDEPGVRDNCLVRSMSLSYRNSRGVDEDSRRGHPAGAFLASVTVAGNRRIGGSYRSRALPPVEFTYSTATIGSEVRTLNTDSLENLPAGLDGTVYRWADLDGESISGVLTEQAGAWFYKPNLGEGRLGPTRSLPSRPSIPLTGAGSQLLDLAGDNQLDLVSLDGSLPGFFERIGDGSWAPHRTFRSLPAVDWRDPNLQFVDLNGDGHADVLLTEDDALVWYPSLAEDGFGEPVRVPTPLDEDAGPRLVLADGTQSVYLADCSGDGLTDLVRVRNGEVCYWPNLGYGRFGAKVVMDAAPLFDRPDRFDPGRIRLADIDSTGPTDLVYLGGDGVDLYRNEMGNSWSAATGLAAFPPVDDVTSVSVVDLLGRGTACLVWSSPLPGDTGRQLRYVDLMGTKPHLLTRVRNNLGAETAVTYASSTSYYLADKALGRPWITRLPFPVHVVERTETFDWINRNRFVTRYSYHHGYFDGPDREFRGFGMVEQYDTEHMAALTRSAAFPVGDNVDSASHLPPTFTRTWFHTGVNIDRQRVSRLFADEYYPPAGSPLPAAAAWLLEDTPLPPGLSPADEREACRALKGQMLRQEVYAQDGTDRQPHPYTVVERNYTVDRLQAADEERHGVFAVHPRETVTVTCERDPDDPRIAHELVLAVDPLSGTVTHSVAVAYGRQGQEEQQKLPLRTRAVQATSLATETHTEVTKPVDTKVDDPPTGTAVGQDAHRAPAPYDTRTYQITGTGIDDAKPLVDRAWLEKTLGSALAPAVARRLLDRQRIRFDSDDLVGPLDWGTQGARGLVYQTYRLALTPSLVDSAFGTRVAPGALTDAGYVQMDGDWWAPSGTPRYAPADTAADGVLAYARGHFFIPRRFVDPFDAATHVEYDTYDLLPVEVIDPVGNQVTAGLRTAKDARVGLRLDYRVLAPTMVTDPNRNRTAVAFDALGLVAATAVMGKPEDDTGDHLAGVATDLADATVARFWADPLGAAPAPPGTPATARDLLGTASTRVVYDLDAYLRTRNSDDPQPAAAAMIAREQHAAAAAVSGPSRLQVSFTYSDGTGREIQKKLPAEPAPGGGATAEPRWVCNGWTIVNNKGKPVREYEPFFTPHHTFEFAVKVGVSPVLCYDPAGRAVATVHPNHTWDKIVIGPWQQETWDVNDTALVPNPAEDLDVGACIAALPGDDYKPTWYQQRITGGLGGDEKTAAERTELHAGTPTLACLDPLGRPVLTIARNRTPSVGTAPPVDTKHRTHVVLDIEGQQLEVADSPDGTPGLTTGDEDRLVARYTYDSAGALLVDESMEAGTSRQLTDVTGKPVAVWEYAGDNTPDRHHATTYDRLRRPVTITLHESGQAKIVERTEYGEGAPNPAVNNLRGQVANAYDGAGVVSFLYDVQGNPTQVDRQLTRQYRDVVDWAEPVARHPEVWTGRVAFDALDRPADQTHPDGTVVRYAYNAGGLLERVEAELPGDAEATAFVTDIDYNAKGQRTLIAYGNGVNTAYDYEVETFRLRHLNTRRGAAFPQDDPVPPDRRRGVQNLGYVYDPAGNITHIQDDAQPRVCNLNTEVTASSDYTYDALYRLIEAHGREHLGMQDGALAPPAPTSATDAPRVNPADHNALGRYRERYAHDVAGNLERLVHRGTDPAHPGWTRTFTYREPSQLEPTRASIYSNRLSSTSSKYRITTAETYHHDVHGNMDVLPPLQLLRWDYRNQLVATSTQSVGAGLVPESTYYCYNGDRQRVRWVRDGQAASVESTHPIDERVYLGEFELYRYYDADGNVTLARSTVHIMDGEQRVAVVETRTDDGATRDPHRQIIRYQHSNHLGSATVELDGVGRFISYEEYYPYGCTALAWWRHGVAPKRYRYTSKERDPSGLYYHGARYYVPWLSRWISPDPSGLEDGLNLFLYGLCNPLSYLDNTGLGATEQHLGARQESVSEAHTRASNELRERSNKPAQEVLYQEGVGGERKVIPDEKRLAGEPGRQRATLVTEQKARNLGSGRNANEKSRRADIRRSLEQVKEQLRAMDASGEGGLKLKGRTFQLKGKVVRVIYDNNRGKDARRALPGWREEQRQVRHEWLEAASTPAERALRARVDMVTTTGDQYARATKALGRRLGGSGVFAVADIWGVMQIVRDANMAERFAGRLPGGTLEDERGTYVPEAMEGFYFDRYYKRYVSGPLSGQTVRLGFIESYQERSKVRDEWGYFGLLGRFVPGRVPPHLRL